MAGRGAPADGLHSRLFWTVAYHGGEQCDHSHPYVRFFLLVELDVSLLRVRG